MERVAARADTLFAHGASLRVAEELLTYNMPPTTRAATPKRVPLANEPHLQNWRIYVDQSEQQGAWKTLNQHLVQLRFPVREGMSKALSYQAATRRGAEPIGLELASGLQLEQSEQLQLMLHQTAAGQIPLIYTSNHTDFTLLIQALLYKNEPTPVPESIGAMLISGYTNWQRVGELRAQWQADNPEASDAAWANELREHIKPVRSLYQDSFILMSAGDYSGVSAEDLGVNPIIWTNQSLQIRLAHETAHYICKRMFGTPGNQIIDEVVADYLGIVAALGRYQSDWALRFLGLEHFPIYRIGGRLEAYRSTLSPEAFALLQGLVVSAIRNLEQLDLEYSAIIQQPEGQIALLNSLSKTSLEELASPEYWRHFGPLHEVMR